MSAGRKYAVTGNCTTGASATIPLANIVSATTVRPGIFDIILSSDSTPADNTAQLALQRSTTVGTWGGAGGAAITPQALDPADPASLCTANQGVCSVGPTLTAAAFLMRTALNQRATFHFQAAPGAEIQMPATANNGLCLVNPVVGGTNFNLDFSFLYQE